MFKKTKDEKSFCIEKFNQSSVNEGTIFLSNSLEILSEFLKSHLFTQSTPFSKRLIIVPNKGIEKWLRFRFAQEMQIACGIEINFLNQAVEKLVKSHFPSELELTLRIDAEIKRVLNSEDSIWKPLSTYVEGKERRRLQIAKQLSYLFVSYGIYGAEYCQKWEKQPEQWQEALWAQIFKEKAYPLKVLSESPPPEDVHLFGFSHLSSMHFQFFRRCFFYQFSPCKEFWSDAGGESPLLHHFGKIGRQMAKQVEESNLSVYPAYLPILSDTQLHRIQHDILHLHHTKDVMEDASVQIHISTTPYREIQNLYNTLLSLMSEKGLEPKDISVFAPNIAPYEPYIRAVFDHYQIEDMLMGSKNLLIQGLFSIFDLDKHRWSAPALLELFHHPLFKQKQGWCESQLMQIREWVEQTGIRWGIDKEHRNELLKRRYCLKGIEDEGATWKEGLGYLLEELSIPHEFKRIDLTQAELLGEVLQVLDQLWADDREREKERNLKEWVLYLKQLCEKYFSLSEDVDAFNRALDIFVYLDSGEKYSFSILEMLLREWIGKETVTVNAHQLQSIKFASMYPMRAIPAKVICLIGMNHDAFPRKENSSLDLIQKGPTRLDSDRYLFLEMLLSAKEKLIISYIGRNAIDLSEEPPSILVAELFPYISKNQIVTHPARSYDHQYFDASHPQLKNYSRNDFQKAKAGHQLQPPQVFFHNAYVEEAVTGEMTIDLKDLIRCIRSPIRHYLYHGCGIVPKTEEDNLDEEAFTLSPLRKSILRKAALTNTPEQVLQRAKKEKDFPLGLFGQLAKTELEEECSNIPLLDAISLEPLLIRMNKGLTVKIIGMLEGVSSDALYLPEKASFRAAVKAWPLFLVSGKSKAIFLDKEKEGFFQDAEPYLKTLIEYYLLSAKVPSPLFPDWIDPILKKDALKMEKNIPLDASLQQLLKSREKLDYDKIIQIWHGQTEKLFQELFDVWF